MNISLNGLWTNTNNFIRTKIAEGLTPLEKKVALIAAAFFALAAVGYLFFQFCRKYPSQIDVIDPKGKDKPVHVSEPGKNESERPNRLRPLNYLERGDRMLKSH